MNGGWACERCMHTTRREKRWKSEMKYKENFKEFSKRKKFRELPLLSGYAMHTQKIKFYSTHIVKKDVVGGAAATALHCDVHLEVEMMQFLHPHTYRSSGKVKNVRLVG